MSGGKEGALRAAASATGTTVEEYKRRIAAGDRWCGFHREWHPMSAFHKSSDRVHGVMSRCAIAVRLTRFGVPSDKPRVTRGHHRKHWQGDQQS